MKVLLTCQRTYEACENGRIRRDEHRNLSGHGVTNSRRTDICLGACDLIRGAI